MSTNRLRRELETLRARSGHGDCRGKTPSGGREKASINAHTYRGGVQEPRPSFRACWPLTVPCSGNEPPGFMKS